VNVDFEVCDDGPDNENAPGSCAPDCGSFIPLPSCGDGTVNAGEQCDEGNGVNGTLASACDVRCQTKCGNGFRDEGEQCDDGVNSGSYGTCNPDCTFAGFCGDGVVANVEACDAGSSNVEPSVAYGNNLCTTQCLVAPTCGDGRVDASFGEICDSSPSCSNACRPIQ
jgi:cysteine-rich repeat protein